MTTDPIQNDVLPTLFACYKPVERYARLLRRTLGAAQPVAVTVSPIDAFLMHQLATLLPERPQVVDLAAEATLGASTALWASHPGVRRVVAAVRAGTAAQHNGSGGNGNGTAGGAVPWRQLFDETQDGQEIEPMPPVTLVPLPQDSAAWEALARLLDQQGPALFLTAPAVETVRAIFGAVPDAAILLLPLGRLGGDPAIDPLLTFCQAEACRLKLLRDLAPFFHESELAIVTRGQRPEVAQALERVQRMYDGNFQFLRLARGLVEAAEREREWCESDGALATGPRLMRGSGVPQRAYRQAVERIRKLVSDVVPSRATVLVVSRGDEELLNLGGRRAWHFPQTEDGVYAGHYPPDSAAAIEHLESLRARGAEVLLLPVTAFWWLRHYAEFARHLEQRYDLLARQDDACILYSLAGSKAAAEPRTGDAARFKRPPQAHPRAGGLWSALRRLLGGGADDAGGG